MSAEPLSDEEDDIGFDRALAVEGARDDLVCAICLRLAEDATQLVCGHLFCSAHIRRRLELTGACPACGTSGEIKDLDDVTRQALARVTFRCVNRECKATCSISNLREHATLTCPYGVVACPLEGCPAAQLYRKDLSAHEEACPFRPVECPTCGGKFTAARIAAHITLCSSPKIGKPLAATTADESQGQCAGEVPSRPEPEGQDEHRVPDSPSSGQVAHLAAHPGAQVALLSRELSILSLELAACRNRLRTVTQRAVARLAPTQLLEESAIDILTYGQYIFSILEDGEVLLSRMGPTGVRSTLLGGRFRNVQCLALTRYALVAGSPGGALRVWANGAAEGTGERELHLRYVMSAIVSEDAAVLRVALTDAGTLWACTSNAVQVFRLVISEGDLKLVATVPLPVRFHDLCMAGDALVCVLHQRDLVVITGTGEMSSFQPHPDRAAYCVFAKGSALYCGARDGGLLCFRAREGNMYTPAGSTISRSQDTCVSIAVNDVGLLAAAHASSQIALYFVEDLDAPSCLHVIVSPDGIVSVAFLEDGTLVHQGTRLHVWK